MVTTQQLVTRSLGSTRVSFDDHSTGSGVAWEWDFGDGSTSTERHPTHTYAQPGDYAVTLTVRDSDGGVDSVTQPYRALAAPEVDFSWPENATEGAVTLTGQTTGRSIVTHRWTVDGTTAAGTTTTAVTSFTFPDDGELDGETANAEMASHERDAGMSFESVEASVGMTAFWSSVL